MFRRSSNAAPGEAVRVIIEGREWTARSGDSVAAALLMAGLPDCRTTPVSGAARAPFCMMGVCFDCLVRIDGLGNQQACMIQVREGMVIERQAGRREAGQ
jgi:sarcosine oxidase subunit alpha